MTGHGPSLGTVGRGDAGDSDWSRQYSRMSPATEPHAGGTY
jgi:hypothetical protein